MQLQELHLKRFIDLPKYLRQSYLVVKGLQRKKSIEKYFKNEIQAMKSQTVPPSVEGFVSQMNDECGYVQSKFYFNKDLKSLQSMLSIPYRVHYFILLHIGFVQGNSH
jgi:hypothetical protein